RPRAESAGGSRALPPRGARRLSRPHRQSRPRFPSRPSRPGRRGFIRAGPGTADRSLARGDPAPAAPTPCFSVLQRCNVSAGSSAQCRTGRPRADFPPAGRNTMKRRSFLAASAAAAGLAASRSEEHTSELQSRFDLVCRLLLEKKNTTNERLTALATVALWTLWSKSSG